jgi:pimeloyl-ACP methyl ester carboxylesterase
MIYLIIILITICLIGIVGLAFRYTREISAARKRIDSLGSQVIETACGPIEYARVGKGYPALVVHGALGGFDHGLWVAHSFNVTDFQVIAISRFGYLRSPIPANADLNLQADLFASLLDSLEIDKVIVFAISAGSTSAIRFTARHPERISALVLVGPDSPGEVQLQMPPRFVFDTLMRSDFIYWILITFFKEKVKSVMGLVPVGFNPTPENEVLLKMFLKGNQPISKRIDGLIFESYNLVSEFNESVSPESPYPLGSIKTPVLVVNSLDDPLAVAENVEALAKLMPNARQYIVPNGGHFFFGHDDEVKKEIAQFLYSKVGGGIPKGLTILLK